jgi:hypothetical protein
MCEFPSWIEIPEHLQKKYGREIFFLTNNELKTKRGRELIKYLGPTFNEDVKGHGAINWYYQLEGVGKYKELPNFRSPVDLPQEIAQAIKDCLFSRIGICIQILTLEAKEKVSKTYEALTKPAWKIYKYKTIWPDENAHKAIEKQVFWRFVKNPENRVEVWR